MIDREAFDKAWVNAFDESLENGLARVKTLLRRFGVMDLWGRDGPGGKGAFDATRTTINDKDFARVAVLSMLGAASLGEELPQMTKLLGLKNKGEANDRS